MESGTERPKHGRDTPAGGEGRAAKFWGVMGGGGKQKAGEAASVTSTGWFNHGLE